MRKDHQEFKSKYDFKKTLQECGAKKEKESSWLEINVENETRSLVKVKRKEKEHFNKKLLKK